MDSENGPISITALLANINTLSPHQQNVMPSQQVYQSPHLPPKQPQSLPPRNPSSHIPNNVQKSNQQMLLEEHNLSQPPEFISVPQGQFIQQNQVQYQPQINYSYPVHNQNYHPEQKQHIHNQIIEPHHFQSIPHPVNHQKGYHLLQHHNQVNNQKYQTIVTQQYVIPSQNIQKHEVQTHQKASRIYDLTQQVNESKPPTINQPQAYYPITPPVIQAKPQISPQSQLPPLSNSRKNIPNTSKVSNITNQNILKCDDKLLDKIQQMQTQINKLSRAIIKKDNQQLHNQLSLNQIIEQKDRILQRKNKQLQASTRRIKLLIEQSESKDLQIQRLKLEIQRANRINNLSVDVSKMEDFEIRNDTDNMRSTAYYQDLVTQSQLPRQGITKQFRGNKVYEGQLSPTMIDLRYAKPAGEGVIYQPSGKRPQQYN